MWTIKFLSPLHDHDACVDDALRQAETLCRGRGVRLTPIRRRVLELIWSDHRPHRAYELLDRLRAERGPVAPPTVYRALDFLLAEGLIHRIESLKAFVGCPRPHNSHIGQFFICDGCGAAAEVASRPLMKQIDASAEKLGFIVSHPIVEVRGLCPECGKQERSGHGES